MAECFTYICAWHGVCKSSSPTPNAASFGSQIRLVSCVTIVRYVLNLILFLRACQAVQTDVLTERSKLSRQFGAWLQNSVGKVSVSLRDG